MEELTYSARAAVRRRRRVAAGIGGCLGAGLLILFTSSLLTSSLDRLDQFGVGTHVYRTAQWASTAALFSWNVVGFSLACWWLAASFRMILGLPRRKGSAWLRAFTALRILLAIPVCSVLIVWSADEVLLRRTAHAPGKALGVGLLLCLMFSYDVPRLLRNALACLAARARLLRAPRAGQAVLEGSGLTRVAGTVAAAGEVGSSPDGDWVYRRSLPEEPDGEVREDAVAYPFLLETSGGPVLVEADAARMVVSAVEQGGAGAAFLRVGDPVSAVGKLHAGGSAYREGAARLEPGEGSLLIFGSGAETSLRLAMAAGVELFAAAGLTLCLTGLLAFWVLTGYIVWQYGGWGPG